MNQYKKISLLTLLLVLLLWTLVQAAERRVFMRENFANLDNWRPVFFPKIKQHSTYHVETHGGISVLKTESRASASALVYKKTFPVYEYPDIRWQWRVMNIYQKGNTRTKAGDDYPLRVYILFQYDPEKAGLVDRIKYGIAKRLYGEYPPQSALNYIWASRREERGLIVTNPFSSETKMIVLQEGIEKVGTWQEEQVNVLDDYRKAFGTNPPAVGTIGVMNDSDNTGESAVSYIRFFEVFSEGRPVPEPK
ncbi:MAG: DUF3047 domain-containing protein [Syntrophaceae bacterium]|nr:DUF3047 domain-containing protein [Syntrophaceae bacterium]